MKYIYFIAFFKRMNKKDKPTNAEITLHEKITNINQVKQIEKTISEKEQAKDVTVISYVFLREVSND